MAVRVLVLHGPNLTLASPDVSPQVIDARLLARANALGVEVRCVSSNHEGDLIDALVQNRNWLQAVIVNPTSLAPVAHPLAEALALLEVPAIEVQLGSPGKGKSALKDAVESQVHGKGVDGYVEALNALAPRAALKAASARTQKREEDKPREPEPLGGSVAERATAAVAIPSLPPRGSSRSSSEADAPKSVGRTADVPKTVGRSQAVEVEVPRQAKTLGRAGAAESKAPEKRVEKLVGERPTAPYLLSPPPRTLGRKPPPPRREARESDEPHGVLTRARVREQIAERLAGAVTPAALSTWARARWADLQAGSPVESGQRDRLDEVLQTLIVSAAQKASDQNLIELMVQLER